MVRKLELLVISLVLIVAAFSTGLPFLFYLLYLAILVIGGSYVLVRLGLTDLEAGYAVSQLHGHVGDRMRVTYTLRNSSRLPKPWLEIHNPTTLPGGLPGRAITLRGRTERSWLIRAPLSRRGHFRIEPLHIRTGDPFGFFEASATVGQGISVVVYPRLEALPRWKLPTAALEGSHATPVRTMQTTPLATTVRPYAPGDAMNRIHWKTTARHGEIQVKEFDLSRPPMPGSSSTSSAVSRPAKAKSRPWRQRSARPLRSPTRRSRRTARSGSPSTSPVRRSCRPTGAAASTSRSCSSSPRSRPTGCARRLSRRSSPACRGLRRGMTAVVITASLDPSWVRPLASLRSRGVTCVVVTLDAAAYERIEKEARAEATGEPYEPDEEALELAAKRARALRHALAEYELRSFVVTPGRALGEILAR
jgi:hypothetical protein